MSISSRFKDHSGKKGYPIYLNFIAIIFLLIIVDISSTLAKNPKLQYIIVVVPILFLLSHEFDKKSSNRFKLIRICGTVLWIFGYTGVYWGKIVNNQTDGALPLIWPLFLLLIGRVKDVNTLNVRKGMIYLGLLANVILLECLVARLFYTDSLFSFSHEKGFLIFFSLFVGVKFNQVSLVLSTLILFIGNFWAYPAFTYLVAGAAAFFTNWLLKRKKVGLSLSVFFGFSLYYVYSLTFEISKSLILTDTVYKLVGRENNMGYRSYLINQVFELVKQQLYFGSYFQKSVLVQTYGSNLPVHNDFVTVLLGGGVVSLTLYFSIYGLINFYVFKEIKRVGDEDVRKAVSCLLILVNAYFYCSTANPISMKTQNGMILMGSICAILSLLKTKQED